MKIEPKIVAARMQLIAETACNEEDAHIQADSLLCELLRKLGYEQAVDIFEKMPKWYS